MAPSPAPTSSPALDLPPSSRMLVDAEYLIEQLVLEAQARNNAQAGGLPSGPETVASSPLAAYGGLGQNRQEMTFAHVRLSGLMRAYTARWVVDALQEAYADSSISGVLLEVDTGGGAVVAASMIRNAVAGRNKPVVVYAHMAASGGMMATMDSDEIVAAGRTARAGSIGVMMSLPKWLRRMYGDYVIDVYADTSPDKNRAFNQWVQNGSTDLFREELNKLDAIFMEEMKAARPINKKMADETLAGGVWLAEEAKARGLVDSIGTFQYALTRLASAAIDFDQR